MAKGTVVYVNGGKIGINTSGKLVEGKPIVDQVVKECKGVPCTVNGDSTNKRIADIKPGMSVRITEVGGKPTNIVAAGGK